MGLVVAVLSGFVLAVLTPLLVRLARDRVGWLLSILPAGLFVYFVSLIGPATAEGITVSYDWASSVGLRLAFRADGLSLLFALIISGVGALVFVYTGGYFEAKPQPAGLYAYLLMFMGSMLGLVLADNLLALFVFWELTSFSSYLLIGFEDKKEKARSAALQALLVTVFGGLALLAGALLLGHIGRDLGLEGAESLSFSSLLSLEASAIREHGLYIPVLILLLLAAFTKSAQFPFHFWLPNAMEAPTPVSAYLHSATMVKAGVYLLARVHPLLSGTEFWLWAVTAFGGVTMVAGAVLALRESDLKRLLAYSTVSALGAMVMLLGLDSHQAVQVALTFLLGHAFYKGALFLVAGVVDHQTGTRDTDQLGGLGGAMPVTATAGLLAALSMAALPPLFGFIAKESFFTATLASPAVGVVTGAALLANMIFVPLAYVSGIRPFIGRPTRAETVTREASLSLWIGPLILGVAGVALGLFPGIVDRPVLAPAVAAVLTGGGGGPHSLDLKLWHGWTPELALSGVTIAGGLVILALRGSLRSLLSPPLPAWGPATWYEWVMAGLNGLAQAHTRVLQSGYLRYYLLTVFLAMVGIVGYTLVSRYGIVMPSDWTEYRVYEIGLGGLIVPGVLAVVWSRSPLAAIAALGVVGYSMALVFVMFGAPDLAMTQFLVETLILIMFVLVFYRQPPPEEPSQRLGQGRDAVVAIAVGVLMTVLVLAAVSVVPDAKVSTFFVERSVPDAHGRNLVNVILVDFRALDTLGEITVLVAAGLGVYTLLKLRLGGDRQ